MRSVAIPLLTAAAALGAALCASLVAADLPPIVIKVREADLVSSAIPLY
jgi:hypothetical protein